MLPQLSNTNINSTSKEKNSNDRRATDIDVNTTINRSRQSRPITVA